MSMNYCDYPSLEPTTDNHEATELSSTHPNVVVGAKDQTLQELMKDLQTPDEEHTDEFDDVLYCSKCGRESLHYSNETEKRPRCPKCKKPL